MPTFGNTNVEAHTMDGWAGYAGACKFTLSETATIVSISLYLDHGNDVIRLAIYSDSAADPDALQCETGSDASSAGWNTLIPTTTPTLSPGVYWLAWQIKDNDDTLRYKVAASNQYAARGYAYAAFPDPFNPAWNQDREFSIYATYTVPVDGYAAIF